MKKQKQRSDVKLKEKPLKSELLKRRKKKAAELRKRKIPTEEMIKNSIKSLQGANERVIGTIDLQRAVLQEKKKMYLK